MGCVLTPIGDRLLMSGFLLIRSARNECLALLCVCAQGRQTLTADDRSLLEQQTHTQDNRCTLLHTATHGHSQPVSHCSLANRIWACFSEFCFSARLWWNFILIMLTSIYELIVKTHRASFTMPGKRCLDTIIAC